MSLILPGTGLFISNARNGVQYGVLKLSGPGAANSVGKGAATASKDLTVGTTKGTGKVVKGIGRAFKHLF